jgi:hypothetical protein
MAVYADDFLRDRHALLISVFIACSTRKSRFSDLGHEKAFVQKNRIANPKGWLIAQMLCRLATLFLPIDAN